MKNYEILWREILDQYFEKGRDTFTQKELAEKFSFSTSTVFHALKIPREIEAVEVGGRFFRLKNAEKLLYLWATKRNLKREVIYETYSSEEVKEREGLMPAGIIFGAYSAYVRKFKETPPADYDKVYVYSLDSRIIEKRFPPKKGRSNLFVLRGDKFLKNYGGLTPSPQIFADLWNLPDWYAKDFLEALRGKLGLSR